MSARLWLVAACLTLLGCTRVDWYENYRATGKQPYDLYALYELLEARPAGSTTLSDSLDLDHLNGVTCTNYLFVGHRPYYGDDAAAALLDYVGRGNTAFLAAGELPEALARQLFGPDCYTEDVLSGTAPFPIVRADSVVAYLYPAGDSFPLVNIRYWEPAPAPLPTISDHLLCNPDANIQVLGSLDTLGINFLRVGWGTGDFYFFSTPRYLTNWYLMDTTAAPYPAAVMSVLDTGRVYRDEYHRRYQQDPAAAAHTPPAYTGGRNLLRGNPTLRYVQQRKELALAWYLVLAGALLYILFRGKRRQRVIPVLPVRQNASRRLIDTISRLGQQQGNHAALARRELGSLRFHLTHRRGIPWREGEPPPPDLGQRLGLSGEVTERALAEIRMVDRGRSLREGDLLRFYRAIEPLYR